MFSSITSYLWGTTEEQENIETEQPSQEATTSETPKTVPLETVPAEEDEWILVEKSELRHGKRVRPQSPEEARKRQHTDLNVAFATTNPFSALSQDCNSVSGDVSPCGDSHENSDNDMLLLAHPSMEESWLVTPPACFTAGTSKMETSSMENLLIEHPSMSVYHHRGRQSSTGVDSENSDSSVEEESEMQHSKNQRQAGLARHQPPHRPRALAARIGLVQAKTVKSMQRSSQKHTHKDLSKNNLRRVNQTQGKHVRKHVVQQPRQRMTTTTTKRQ